MLSNADGVATSSGFSVGDSLAPVPEKLADRIRRWKFIDMGELLPEARASLRDDDKKSARRPRQVTDVLIWVQYFATYMGVLASAHPP